MESGSISSCNSSREEIRKTSHQETTTQFRHHQHSPMELTMPSHQTAGSSRTQQHPFPFASRHGAQTMMSSQCLLKAVHPTRSQQIPLPMGTRDTRRTASTSSTVRNQSQG